jgi:hypothetical protein
MLAVHGFQALSPPKVPVHVRPRSPAPDGTHFVSPTVGTADDVAAVITALAGAAGDASVAPAPGSAASATSPRTAATIPNNTAAERRLNLNLNIPGPSGINRRSCKQSARSAETIY